MGAHNTQVWVFVFYWEYTECYNLFLIGTKGNNNGTAKPFPKIPICIFFQCSNKIPFIYSPVIISKHKLNNVKGNSGSPRPNVANTKNKGLTKQAGYQQKHNSTRCQRKRSSSTHSACSSVAKWQGLSSWMCAPLTTRWCSGVGDEASGGVTE